MARRFLRRIVVIVGDAEEAIGIEDLLIRFLISNEASPTPASGHVDIVNLNDANERRIRERGKKIVVRAGYEGGELGLVLDGVVRRVERKREGLDRVTRVFIGGMTADGEGPLSARRALVNQTWQGEVSVRDLVLVAAAKIGLPVSGLDLIPEDAVEVDFRYVNGSAQQMLTGRLRPYGIEWFEQDGAIRLSRFAMSGDDRPQGIVISEATGMLDTPQVLDDGMRIKTLLDVRLKLDTRVRVESPFLERGGYDPATTWKVTATQHNADNREGDFYTLAELSSLNE